MSITIHDLGPKEIITEPGFYRLSLDRHHNGPCDGPSVTSSVLRKLEVGSPLHVWAFHYLNPDRYDDADRGALRMGRAMHSWVEGGRQALERDFIVIPSDAPSKPTKAQLASEKPSPTAIRSISFWEAVSERLEATGRSLISQAEYETIAAMGEALAADPLASAVVGGEPEITMAWKDEETGLWCLSRLDNLTGDGLLSDYKKISTAYRPMTPALCRRRIEDGGYHQQLAFGAEGYFNITGNWPTDCALVFQEDKPPYAAITIAVGGDPLYWGMCANHRSLRLFRQCLDADHWPGPGENPEEFNFRDFQTERMQQRQAEGDLPNLDIPTAWRG